MDFNTAKTNGSASKLRDLVKAYAGMAGTVESSNLHPEISNKKYPVDAINPLHRNFDKKLFLERRRCLTSISDRDALFLSHDDQYDRSRYLSENESMLLIMRSRKEADENKLRQEIRKQHKRFYSHWQDKNN